MPLLATQVVPLRKRSTLRRPLFLSRVPAGWPSPADDYIETALDLNEALIRHPESTFFVRVEGDSMRGAGIHSDDVLIVDRAEEPRNGSVVVAALDGELTVKRMRREAGELWLVAENDAYPPVRVTTELVIWGVVHHVVHEIE